MALAWWEIVDNTLSGVRFRFDLGKNRYYQYAIGTKERHNRNGLPVLSQVSYSSKLIGPLPPSSLGMGMVEIPKHLFDEDHHYIQLYSFRDNRKHGPAISSIEQVNPDNPGLDHLPALQFSKKSGMKDHETRNIPFDCKEIQPRSEAMFWGAITGLLPKVLPVVQQVVGAIAGGGGGATGGAAAGGGGGNLLGNLLGLLKGEQGQDLITKILGMISGGTGNTTSAAKTVSQSMSHRPYRRRYRRTMRPRPRVGAGKSRFPTPEYSEAKNPALIAALPALAPVLEKLANPETIKAIGDVAHKPFDSTVGVVRDFFGLNEKLEAPRLEDPALDQMLQNNQLLLTKLLLETGKSKGQSLPYLRQLGYYTGFSERIIDFRRSNLVKLECKDNTAVTLDGKTLFPYTTQKAIRFPLRVSTPQTISQALFKMVVKKEDGQQIITVKKHRLENVASGDLVIVPELSDQVRSEMESGQNYLICFKLIWKNKKGISVGTSHTKMITIVDDYFYTRTELSDEIIPFNDIEKHRAFWHRMWMHTAESANEQIALDCKYYYTVEPTEAANGRMETLIKEESESESNLSMKLKSGMAVSLDVLNSLLPTISNYPQLTEHELKAIKVPQALREFNRIARIKVNFTAIKGDQLNLWAYPEFKIARLNMKQPQEINEDGSIATFQDVVLHFPVPHFIHFLGARTE